VKAVIIADPHVGADKFGTNPSQWDAPFSEAVQYAVQNHVRLFICAGDLFHRRNPTTEDYDRALGLLSILDYHGIEFLVIDGNHDVGTTIDSIPATWSIEEVGGTKGGDSSGKVAHGRASTFLIGGIEVIALPWPRWADYGVKSITLKDLLQETKEAVLKHLRSLSEVPRRQGRSSRILVGHASISSGALKLQGPPLLLGKDVVLPVEELQALDVDAIFLGHIHSQDEYYVGSTQPTDWADTHTPKSFAVYDSVEKTTERVPYRSSLKLLTIEATPTALNAILKTFAGQLTVKYDVARARVVCANTETVDPGAIRASLGDYAHRVESVEVVKPPSQHRRVAANNTPLNVITPDELLATWLDSKGVVDPIRTATLSTFRALATAITTTGATPTERF